MNPNEYARLFADGRIKFGATDDSSPKRKLFLNERLERGDSKTPSSVLLNAGTTKDGTSETMSLFGGEKVFSYPKPVALIRRLLDYICAQPTDDAIILDFFAGSGTTGHAVMEQNAADGGRRRFVLVQLPEPTGRADYPSIADLTAERLRRAGAKVREANPMLTAGGGDTGFRVFKLDTANVRAWEAPTTDALEPGQAQQLVEESIDAVKPGRSDADLLWGVMLNLGLPLDGQIETHTVGDEGDGKTVYVAGAGTLLACFADHIDRPGGETLAVGLAKIVTDLQVEGEVTVVLRDSAFQGNDAAKVNLVENLRQRLPEGVTARVRSI